jgi:CRP-like cAMP-binding protein
MNKAEFLKQTPLFAGCSREEIATVLATARERTFDTGATIIREGHEGASGFYLLLEGAAEVRKGGTILATFGPGDYFGEMALLLEDTPRTADVVTTEPSTCLAITRWDLRAMISNNPDVGVRMMGELAKRLRDTDRGLGD